MKKMSLLIGRENWQVIVGNAARLAYMNKALLSLIVISENAKVPSSAEQDLLSLSEIQAIMDRRDDERNEQLAYFRSTCDRMGVLHEAWQPCGDHFENVLLEALYSDLLIMTALELKPPNGLLPGAALRRLLEKAQCPVLLLPELPTIPSRTMLLYDGSTSAVYAIKLFAYLLPDLVDRPVEVIQVTEDNNGMTESKRLTDFIRCHHADVTYTVLHGHPKQTLHEYLAKGTEPTLIVMGAYGRSRLSRWLRGSMADVLLCMPGYSMLIAH